MVEMIGMMELMEVLTGLVLTVCSDGALQEHEQRGQQARAPQSRGLRVAPSVVARFSRGHLDAVG